VAYVGNQPARGQWRKLSDISSAFDGVITTFTTSVPPGTSQYFVTAGSASQLLISLGGVIQEPDVDYTVSTNSVTFTTPPTSGLSFFGVLCGDALNAGVPSDGSVTTSKLAGGLSVGLTGGSVSTPSLFFTGDSNTGIYSPGADQVAVATNGANRLSISSAGEVTTTNEKLNLITVGRGGGAVATNTAVGTGALAVNSTGARLTAVGNNAGAVNTASDNAFVGYNTGAANTSGTNNTAVGSQALATNISGSNNTAVGYTTLLVSTGSNNTGVGGGTYPLATLANNTTGGSNTAVGTSALSSNSTGSSNICFGKDSGSALTTGSNNTIIGSIAGTAGLADTVIIGAGTTERLRIDSSGRLLVGTSTAFSTSSNALIQAVNTSGGEIVIGRDFALGSGSTIGRLAFFTKPSAVAEAARIEAVADALHSGGAPTRLVFSTTASGASSPTERMRITSSGQTKVFSSSDYTFLAYSVKGANATTDRLFAGIHSATDLNTGTLSFQVWTNGNVQNTNNSYGAISDIKLKENIVDANSQWDDLKALQVRNYNFKPETNQETHTQIGLVAQEVELVSPGLVSESPDRDEDGNDLGTVTKSVNYSVLYMKAVKALQEAMERIEILEATPAAGTSCT
jgi:hypothetical protein